MLDQEEETQQTNQNLTKIENKKDLPTKPQKNYKNKVKIEENLDTSSVLSHNEIPKTNPQPRPIFFDPKKKSTTPDVTTHKPLNPIPKAMTKDQFREFLMRLCQVCCASNFL